MCAVPILGKWKQEGQKFKVSLGYVRTKQKIIQHESYIVQVKQQKDGKLLFFL